MLKALRETNPAIPMISSLDIEDEEEDDDEFGLGVEVQREEPSCSDPQCLVRFKSWTDANKNLGKTNETLQKEVSPSGKKVPPPVKGRSIGE